MLASLGSCAAFNAVEYLRTRNLAHGVGSAEAIRQRPVWISQSTSLARVVPGTGWEGLEDGSDAAQARRRTYHLADLRAQPK